MDRASLALVSKFFKALFSHQFEDSRAPVLHLDAGGEMGLTVAAVKVLEIVRFCLLNNFSCLDLGRVCSDTAD